METIDRNYLESIKKLEKKKELVTIKTRYYTIKTNYPERWTEYDGEVIFDVVKKSLTISEDLGKIISKVKDGNKFRFTVSANNIKSYKEIISQL